MCSPGATARPSVRAAPAMRWPPEGADRAAKEGGYPWGDMPPLSQSPPAQRTAARRAGIESSAIRPWLIWGVGVAIYMVAVFQRSSLGVAATEAFARFDITAA